MENRYDLDLEEINDKTPVTFGNASDWAKEIVKKAIELAKERR